MHKDDSLSEHGNDDACDFAVSLIFPFAGHLPQGQTFGNQ